MTLVFFVEYHNGTLRLEHYFSFVQRQSDIEFNTLRSKRVQEAPRCGEFLCFSGEEFVELYNQIDAQRLNVDSVPVTFEDQMLNTYVNNFAQGRGYLLRSFADSSRLVLFNGLQTLPEVRNAYNALKDEMLKQGIALHFVSGYRDLENQRRIFLSKLDIEQPNDILTGAYDEQLAKVLERSALPGYSKHHSGYAVDFGCGNDYLVFEFAETECYQWMSQNNFEPIKKYGFIPSYPEDVMYQGPNPEPWEYVYVGTDYLK